MLTYWWILIPIVLVIALTATALSRRRARPRETAMEAYVDGLRCLTAGDEQTAFIKFRQAVDQDTGNVDAYLKMGDIFRNRGFTDKALQIHRELTLRRDLTPESRIEIDKSLAQDYIKANMADKAQEVLENLVKDSSSRRWAAERLVEMQIANRKWRDACELYEDIMKKGARNDGITLASLKLMMGKELHELEEFHKARIVYKEALSLNRGNPLPYLYIAESYLDEKRVEDGLEFLKKLCEEAPRHAYLGFGLIEETLFQLGRYGEVEDIYRNLLSRDSGNSSAKIALAGILEKKGELSSAETMLRSVLDTEPMNSLAAYRLLVIMANRNRINEGFDILCAMADKMKLGDQEFKCRKCGRSFARPMPACPQCNAIGTFL